MAEKKRSANIELLRIVAMMMVVIMHFLRESASLPAGEAMLLNADLTTNNLVATFLEGFCIVAVNAYVLISGYFGMESIWRPLKAIRFLCQIWFYALLIPLVLKCFGVPVLADKEGIYGLLQYLLPIGTEHYWFATSYFYLLLMMPLLNLGIKAMDRKQFTILLVGLLLFFCGIKSICPLPLATDHYGYDLVWFICVYLVGAWLRSFGDDALVYMKKKALLIYVGSSLLISVITAVLYCLTGHFSGLAYYATVPFHYNFILCLLGAVGLFFVFRNWSIKEGKTAEIIRKIGKYCFGVYLFHEHLDIRYQWYPFLKRYSNPLGKEGLLMLFVELLFSLVVIFIIGIGIDFTRDLLFEAVSKRRKRK